MLFQKLSFVFALCVLTDCAYINLPGQPFDFQCPAGQVISRVSSVYDVLLEDRQWEFGCRTENVTQTCSTSGYANDFGLPLSYSCPGKKVLTGIRSYHDNQIEDRRFTFRCCDVMSKATTGCHVSEQVNQFNGPMLLEVSAGQAIKGAISQHDVAFEDRVWKFKLCKV
ncbi:dermatopontin-like [Biomphalaria glabrata]|nr:dermatopontin-like [Biomphalaria glabrata]KAI8757453.1 dermatopontin dermatopontin Cell adhesion/Resistant factor [Biomphalaria glabrata]KAI8798940.1 dermatopontin [Biomphalaria glabrata]